MISENAECTLNASLSGTAKELFNRMLKRPGKQKSQCHIISGTVVHDILGLGLVNLIIDAELNKVFFFKASLLEEATSDRYDLFT
ncbi:hypothetical protein JTB14_024446 [Gonioctena quinquepunctata]|nr:hypothetical protein JTB14_024446 [Gonioctena quinquepunctata]